MKDGSSVQGGIFLLFQLNQSGVIHDSEHYNSRLRGVDVDLGNNPLVSGVSMSGAQLCSIEDVTIRGEAFHSVRFDPVCVRACSRSADGDGGGVLGKGGGAELPVTG